MPNINTTLSLFQPQPFILFAHISHFESLNAGPGRVDEDEYWKTSWGDGAGGRVSGVGPRRRVRRQCRLPGQHQLPYGRRGGDAHGQQVIVFVVAKAVVVIGRPLLVFGSRFLALVRRSRVFDVRTLLLTRRRRRRQQFPERVRGSRRCLRREL